MHFYRKGNIFLIKSQISEASCNDELWRNIKIRCKKIYKLVNNERRYACIYDIVINKML